jgi:hypothetical protein
MPAILPNPISPGSFLDDANLLSLSCKLSLFPLSFRTVIQHSPAVYRLPRQVFYTTRNLLNPVQQRINSSPRRRRPTVLSILHI